MSASLGLFVTVLLCAVSGLPALAEKIEQLKPQGYVSDFAGVLDAGARERIAALCAEVDQKTHAQMAVVTIRSLDGDTAQNFANRLFKQWGVGYKPENRGLLILLAINDRQYWVEVGYGLEPILNDAKIGSFGREVVPRLRQGDYGGALAELTWRIADVIARDRGVSLADRGTGLTSGQSRRGGPPARSSGASWFGPLILLALFFSAFRFLVGGLFWPIRGTLLGIRASRYRGGGGWWLGGMGGGSGGGGGSGFGGDGGFGGFGGGESGGGGAGGGW